MPDCREKTCIIEDLSRRRRAQPRAIAQSFDSAHYAICGLWKLGKRRQESRGFGREAGRRDVVAFRQRFLRILKQSLRENIALRFIEAKIFPIDSLFDLIDIAD
jgi:hypothetical protein